MPYEPRLFLFGDQTYDNQPHRKDLMRYRQNPVLENFLAKSYEAIRNEIYNLPVELRTKLPRFTCLDDLLLWKQDGQRVIALDMALTCLYQLSVFISQADSWEFYSKYSGVIGLCTGALAAAAVVCSRNTLELVPIAVDAVVVAFRTGMRVADMAQRLDPSDSLDQSWSFVVPGASSAEAVEKYRDSTTLPLSARPYISAYSPNGITVSGPPRSLGLLYRSRALGSPGVKSISIFGPYHAPHLYSQEDVDDIVGVLGESNADSYKNLIPIFSSAGSLENGTFGQLLKNAVSHILLEPIRWNNVIETLQNRVQSGHPDSFSIVPIATKSDHQLIYAALRKTPLASLLPSTSTQNGPAVDISGEGDYAAPSKPKLAIVGMSGRFPGAKDNEAFWRVLHGAMDMHKTVPPLRWDAETHVDPEGKKKNTSKVATGSWLDDPASFDARFFNISPREAPQIDPAQRLALMTAYEAVEQAGIVPDATPSTRRDRVGVFYGVTSQDWFETNSAQQIDTYFIPGGNMAFIPGRINYYFKFSGPSYAVNTACSSSLAGIHLACNSLWRGDIDTAIAGGTNVLTNPDMTAGLDKGHFLSRTGNCKTFDDTADGYCRGEGVGTVILKRLDDAIADEDPILGVILGAYTNHSAESESITRPHVGAQRDIFKKVLNQSATDPYSVGYVEMHGTGTQAGDAGEMSSVLDTFAPPLADVPKPRDESQALYLGSAKANIGHGEAASGMASLIKVLLMLKKNTIVPHAGIKTKINHKFPTDMDQRNVFIAMKPTPWERSSDPLNPRRAFVNNFSAAGGNSALLLEDAPVRSESTSAPDSRTHHVVAVSAKNGASLQGNLQSLLDYLKQTTDIDIGQLSYTTTARRIHHPHRVMLTGSSTKDLCSQIDDALKKQTGMTRPKGSPKIIFTFTGQGAQYPGMAKELFESFSLFRTEMRRLDRIAQSLGFQSILPFIESTETDVSIFDPVVVQLASVCVQVSLSKLWASWNITPIAVVGHSLGEYAALNVAGVLSDADMVYLVGSRAKMLQERCTRDTHSMLVVKASTNEIANVLKKELYETACINSSTETVLAGLNDEISKYKDMLTDAGLKTTMLKVPYAFHSSQVDPILDDFQELASGATFYEAKVPVICPLDGSIVDGFDKFGPEYLARHTREPVNMQRALLAANSHHIMTDQSTVLEIGPHPAITGMVKAVHGNKMTCLASLQRGRSTFQVLTSNLKTLYMAGANIQWSAYHADFKASHKVLPIPAYSWDLKPYWIQYVNNWSLAKGDRPKVDRPKVISESPQMESTTIHRVIRETGDSNEAHMVVEADVTRKDFRPLVEGHEVDGKPLCTPAVYAEMALSLGNHLLERYSSGKKRNTILNVSDMTILKALILRADDPEQRLQAHADADFSAQKVFVKFTTFDQQKKLQEHSHCTVRFTDGSMQEKLQKEMADVKHNMDVLRAGLVSGDTARFNRAMAYRAIRPLARFHDEFRAVDEIVLNSKTLESSSRLNFGSFHKEGDFHTHPGLLDSLTWSSGFAMNCNDNNDLDREVFVNHGWGSFQMFEPLSFSKEYTTYSRMVEGKDRLWHGEINIMDGDRVVAHFGQFAMQGVPRRLLRIILSAESKDKAKPQQKPAQKKKINAPELSKALDNAKQEKRKEPKAQPKAQPQAQPATSPTSEQALAIIAEESGLALEDLTDNTVFGDAGIDSLLGLTISARFKEELDMDLDINALFYEYPTVGDLKRYLTGGQSESSNADTSTGESSDAASTPETDSASEEPTGATTPFTEVNAEDATSKPEDGTSNVDFKRALEIISEESGVAADDLTDDTNFGDAGVDSLLSLVIVSRFRDELGMDIQHESLFLECPTVADLKETLVGTSQEEPVSAKAEPSPALSVVEDDESEATAPSAKPASVVELSEFDKARKQKIDEYVEKYIAGWSAPVPKPRAAVPNDNEKVVLVTGASGSLGGHLTFKLAHLSDVKTVICLNRENRAGAFERQKKAMKDKGVHFPEDLLSKLEVHQADTSKPMLGLSKDEYEKLVNSVTHVVHQAWPMSVKRPLPGFEPQFSVMRNLIDLASAVTAQRPKGFRFGFQLVSSISVVGNYAQSEKTFKEEGKKTMVPEDRVNIDALLPVGYAEAKWGCERMLDETLHKHPDMFRPMTVRLGQIAGSSVSGYWNPMEHFGFLIKSSQTLNALPDVDGTVYWTPVNEIAGTLCDLVLSDRNPYPVYHIENPVGQQWTEVNAIIADALGIPKSNMIPLEEWTQRVKAAPQRDNPASTLADFLGSNYKRMSCGGLVLDAQKTLEHSQTLSAVGPVTEEVIRRYIYVWKTIGFLKK
uniref:Polyketide synthase n=1 Tax=Pestalotiopsis microspora TaxID=85828 RepID=A0A1P8NTH3_PESMI|nr:polyketide synthase [Pestalotiopsis microspora]